MRRWISRVFLLVSLFNLAYAQSLTGTWQHTRDSDGTTPKKGKTMSLTFDDNGRCHLKATDASGKEKTVTGEDHRTLH